MMVSWLGVLCACVGVCTAHGGDSMIDDSDPIMPRELSRIYRLIEKNEQELLKLKLNQELEIDNLKAEFNSAYQSLHLKYQNLKSENQKLTNHLESIEKLHEHNSPIKAIGRFPDSNVISFTAHATVTRNYNAGAIILFDAIVREYGNLFNEDLSIFTCPANGYYLFSVHISNANLDGNVDVSIVIQGEELVAADVAPDNNSGSTSVVTYCGLNQEVWVKCLADGDTVYGGERAYATFSGTLLSIAD